MTDTVATRSFESILAEVRQVIGAERYEIWFAKVRMISLFRGVVTLGVPNLVYRDWITENYLPALEEASERSMGARLRFELKVDPELQRELQEKIATDTLQELLGASGPGDGEGPGLDQFVRLPENETAYRAVRHLVSNESFAFNPLYILGPAGSGKTHLLRAFKRYEGGADPKAPRLLYLDAERFTRAYTMALKKKTMAAFRARFEDVDVVLFDEVHRFRGRKSTQHEFMSLLKSLLRRNVQVVMAARHHPREIYEITESFKSNLLSGMMVSIDPYSPASLQKLVADSLGQAKASGGGRKDAVPRVPREVLRLLSKQVGGNVSLLLARLDQLYSLASAKGQAVDLAFARDHLKEIAGATGIEREVERLIDSVCGHFGVDHVDLMSKRKLKRLLMPRALVAVVMRDRLDLGFKRIGQMLGGRSHSAVHSMIEKYRSVIAEDGELRDLLARLPIGGHDDERSASVDG
ncbi:MAG: AAA family ATPase [Planctomycetes bacterium]|nr:AAA family ATPase [Planctomycetota bacterium]